MSAASPEATPGDLDALLALPGVGPYTARAVLVFAFERDEAVVDTNVGRILARLGGCPLTPGRAQVRAEHAPFRFARIPIYRETLDTVTGYVARFDIGLAAAEGEEERKLRSLARPITAFPEQASVAYALESMLEQREHIALVVDEYGGTAGIVTLEDLLEELLGQEIVDETDVAVDMQAMAKGDAGSP